jgi:predicted transcriptional regulator
MAAHLKARPSKHRPEDTEPETLSTTEFLDLLGDEYTRRVFEAVAEAPRTGREVAEEADVSRPTAYRRLNDLQDAGLVRTETALSEDGHHRERFEAVAASMTVSLEGDHIETDVRVAD